MLRAIALAAAALVAVVPLAASAAVTDAAPADEYFGRYSMSVLGIGNVIRDATRRFDDSTDGPSMTSGPLAFVGDAIRDWECRYPNDPWIPKDLFLLEIAYLHAHSELGNAYATKAAQWLVHDYPNSHYANDGRFAYRDALGTDFAPLVSALPVPQLTVSEAMKGGEITDPAWARFGALRAPLPTPR